MMKQCDGNASQAFHDAGEWSPINPIVQGTAANQRIGREVRTHRLRGRFTCFPTASASSSGEALRFIVLYDKHCNATLGSSPFPITDLLTYASPMAPFSIENEDRFIILYDRFWRAPGYTLSGTNFVQGWGPTSQDTFSFEFDIEVPGLPSVFGDVVGAPPITGALYCVFVGQATSVASAKFVVAGTADIWFTDH